MITTRQCAAGRVVLKWSRAELSQASHVTERAIADFEENGRALNESSRQALRSAFETSGLVVTEDGASLYSGPLRGITPDPCPVQRHG